MARGKIEKRGQRRRKIKHVILIVTEGSQTEPKYFAHYRNRKALTGDLHGQAPVIWCAYALLAK